jgi:uncharacterized membrane protein
MICSSAATEAALPEVKNKRLVSVDILRGLIMILMALDHTRAFFCRYNFSPLDFSQTTAPFFMTRWITHFCAPLFIFLAGVSAFLSLANGKTEKELSRYLFFRGLLLLLLEVAYMSKLWTFSMNYFHLQVIWAIGWSMIILSILIRFPEWFIFMFGIVNVLGHNLLDNVQFGDSLMLNMLWSFLHKNEVFKLSSGITIGILYPLIPWAGVMALGYVFGKLFVLQKTERIKKFIIIGITLIISFIIIRGINIYGDPAPWTIQKDSTFTILSFINCEKYPPSLLYLLMTLGTGILFLGLLEVRTSNILKPLAVFGRVPLFYYIIHLPLIIILLCVDAMLLKGLSLDDMFTGGYTGYGLPGVYLVKFIVVTCLYVPCRWYLNIKKKKNWKWLKYI